MQRRQFIKNIGLGAAAMGFGSTQAFSESSQSTPATKSANNDSRKPNVIVVFIDQLRSFAMGCHGNKFVKTPNIDTLAANGYRFDLGVSNNPVCVPARSALLSGQHARTCAGSRINECEGLLGRKKRDKFPDPTLPEVLKQQGYKTAVIGKWHIDAHPSQLGFDQSLLTGSIFSRATFMKDEKEDYAVPIFSSDHEITKVKEFFKENKHEQEPFFLYYNIISPHMPLLDVPYKYSRMYDPARVPLRNNVYKDGKLPSDEMWFHIYMWQQVHTPEHQPVTSKATPDFTVKDLTALYYGSVTWVDDLIGEMMTSLKENGLEDDTIIVFTADHGDMLGSHHYWNKERVYEEAIRVPMIYHCPGKVKKGVNDSQVTGIIDVMPTVLDLCNTEIPQSVQGQSVASLMDGSTTQTTLEKNYAFIETPHREIGIRTPTHMYAVKQDKADTRIENDNYLFFDMQSDPYQQKNLIKTGQQNRLAQELHKKVAQWNKNTPKLDKSVNYIPWP